MKVATANLYIGFMAKLTEPLMIEILLLSSQQMGMTRQVTYAFMSKMLKFEFTAYIVLSKCSVGSHLLYKSISVYSGLSNHLPHLKFWHRFITSKKKRR